MNSAKLLFDAANDLITPERYRVIKRFAKAFLAFVAAGYFGHLLGLDPAGQGFLASVALAGDRYLQNKGAY